MIPVNAATLEAIPSTAEYSAGGIGATLQQARHIVGLVLDSFVIGGPSRSEKLIAYALPIQVQLIKTMACYVRARLPDDPVHLEFAAQHGCRTARHVIRSWFDPLSAPVRRLQQPHLPISRRTPLRSRPLAVP